jgi:hypothetical protein
VKSNPFPLELTDQNDALKLSCPTTRHGGVWGSGGIAPTHSRRRHQMGVSGQLHAPAAL